PVLQSINSNKITQQEAAMRAAIEVAKQKAQDAANAAAQARQDKLDAEDRADARANTREDRADARATAKEAAKPPTANQLLGQGTSLADQVNVMLHPTDAAVA